MPADNIVVMNQGSNPLVNFNFMLRVELAFDLPCKSVKAFARELEYELIQEGGLNDYVHMRRKPISKPFTLEVERYVGVDYFDPLPLGSDLVLPLMLFVSRSPNMFEPLSVARTYMFTGCTVMKKSYGDLSAEQAGLLLETTTIGYRELLVVDVPFSPAGDTERAPNPNKATNAATADKNAADYKALGNMLHNQALEAKQKAGELTMLEYEDLVAELEQAVEKLTTAVAPGGKLKVAMEQAEKASYDSSGKHLSEVAKESRAAAEEKKDAMEEARSAWEEKNEPYQKSLSKLNDLISRDKLLTQQIDALKAKIEAYKQEKTTLEDLLPEDMRTLAAAEGALNNAQKKYDDAQAEEQAAKAAYDAALQARRELAELTGEEPEDDDEEMQSLRASMEAAAVATAAAATELSDASVMMSNVERYLELEDGIQQAEQDVTTAEETQAGIAEERSAAQAEVDGAVGEVDSLLRDYEEAQAEYGEAQAKAETDETNDLNAKMQMMEARLTLKRAEREVIPLQNNLTNLRSRKDKFSEAQEKCNLEYDRCNECNNRLQGMADEPLGELANMYYTVRGHSRETLTQERLVHETKQYMLTAEKLLSGSEDLLERIG